MNSCVMRETFQPLTAEMFRKSLEASPYFLLCILSKCERSERNPDCMELFCEEKVECLIEKDRLDNLLQWQNDLDWTPGNYSQFWGKTLEQGKWGKLGTEDPQVSVLLN